MRHKKIYILLLIFSIVFVLYILTCTVCKVEGQSILPNQPVATVKVEEQSKTEQTNQSVATVIVGKTYGTANIGGDFNLIDNNGKKRTNKDFLGKYMLVYFGYSFCPDICPMALNNITQGLNESSLHVQKNIVPIFITIDPERDTIEHLNSYIGLFHEKFIALTGNEKEITKVINLYKVYAQRNSTDSSANDYLMDHSSIVYLLDKRGNFITSFDHQTPVIKVVEILKNNVR